MKIYLLLIFGLILQSCVQLKIENKKTQQGGKAKSINFSYNIPFIGRHYTHVKLKDDNKYIFLKTRLYTTPCKCSPVPGHKIKKSYISGIQSTKHKELVDKYLFIKRSKDKTFNNINNRKILKEKIKLNTIGNIAIKHTKVYDNKRILFLGTMHIDTIPKKKAVGVIFISE